MTTDDGVVVKPQTASHLQRRAGQSIYCNAAHLSSLRRLSFWAT